MKYVMASLLALGMFTLVGCEENAFEQETEAIPGETRTETLPQDIDDPARQPHEYRTPGEQAATIDPPADTATTPDTTTTPDATEDSPEPPTPAEDPADKADESQTDEPAVDSEAVKEVEVE